MASINFLTTDGPIQLLDPLSIVDELITLEQTVCQVGIKTKTGDITCNVGTIY